MKYEVACVEDLGDKYRVKYVDNYQNSTFKNDGLYVKISNVAADVILSALSDHRLVFLPKDVSGEYSITDVVVVDTDGLEKNKMIFVSDIYRKINYYLFYVSAVDFFEYMSTFSELAAEGYFISSTNREEKYLAIIETGDERLISLLEVYLDKKDKISKISYVYNKSKSFEKRALECTTQEELDKIIEEFKSV